MNKYEYGTLESFLWWCFYDTSMTLKVIKKKAAKKFSITQIEAERVFRIIFNESEILERSKKNARKNGATFDTSSSQRVKITESYLKNKMRHL